MKELTTRAKETAAIYVRSSKDRHDVSCEAQQEELIEYVTQKGYRRYIIYTDKALSSTRDARPGFDEMITQASSANPPFSTIICKDTSRFGRDSTEKNVLLWQLRNKHGIDVIFKDMPHTGSFMDEAFEQIMSAMDYIHSQQSKVKGVASMKQNVRQGYRSGGRAPYGYQLEEVVVTQHINGDDITKTRLVPDPMTAPYAKEYFERRARNEPRKAILEDFQTRGVPAPVGSTRWAVSTAKSMEDNIEVYRGHTVFNRHNERLKKNGKPDGYKGGKKFRPREEWVICENTHEPLVSEADALVIISNKEKGLRDSPYNRKTYPLTGVLKCGICGSNFAGDSGYYRCNAKGKIGCRCRNNGMSQKYIEGALAHILSTTVLKLDTLENIIDRVREQSNPQDTSRQAELEQQLVRVEGQRQKLIQLHMRDLIDDKDLETELKSLNAQRTGVTEALQAVETAGQGFDISREEIRHTIEHLSSEIRHADPDTLRMVFNNLFREIKVGPKTKKSKHPQSRLLSLKGISIPFTGVKVASPRGFEPLSPA